MHISRRQVLSSLLSGLAAAVIVPEPTLEAQELRWPVEWYRLPTYNIRYCGWPSEATKAREYCWQQDWAHDPSATEFRRAQVQLRDAVVRHLQGRVIGWRIWPQWRFDRFDDGTYALKVRTRYFVSS